MPGLNPLVYRLIKGIRIIDDTKCFSAPEKMVMDNSKS